VISRLRSRPSPQDLQREFFPEVAAGGFSRVDGTIDFYVRVAALLRADMTVVDLGAGRGEFTDDPVPYRRDLRCLRGRVARVIGVDVDPVVRDNPGCDEVRVIEPGRPIDLPDASVDLVLSDHTFEHLDDPAATVRELDRILVPGGWICARTPNRWGYIGLGAQLVPNGAHVSMLRRLQPGRQSRDVFPVRYRLNTLGALRRHFPRGRFRLYAYTVNAEPWYFGASRLAWSVMFVLGRLAPQRLGAKYMIFLQKGEEA
jgi:SAM-dependent methyltransferase